MPHYLARLLHQAGGNDGNDTTCSKTLKLLEVLYMNILTLLVVKFVTYFVTVPRVSSLMASAVVAARLLVGIPLSAEELAMDLKANLNLAS